MNYVINAKPNPLKSSWGNVLIRRSTKVFADAVRKQSKPDPAKKLEASFASIPATVSA